MAFSITNNTPPRIDTIYLIDILQNNTISASLQEKLYSTQGSSTILAFAIVWDIVVVFNFEGHSFHIDAPTERSFCIYLRETITSNSFKLSEPQ